MNPYPAKPSVIIIGGGIIGLCSAYYLLKQGYQPTVIDQGNLLDNCSSGNAGMIVPSHFVPLAAPGMISQGIKWMFDSKSPFYVKPSLNPALLSWGVKFWKHANAQHVANSAVPLRDLHLLSKQLYDELEKEPELDFGLEKKGILMLYKTQATGHEEIHLASQAQQLGLDVAVLNAQQVQDLEPDTELNVLGAVHYRCDGHLYPNALVQQLIAYLQRNDVQLITHCKVTGFEIDHGEIKAIKTEKGNFVADLTVMTGGAWLPELAKMAKLNIPVMPGKGYSFMVDPQQKKIHHPALLLEARVAVTPMNGQVRFGGTMEIAPINKQINQKRVQGIVDAIPQYYKDHQVAMPQLDQIWYGFRPCSPDGLPYIGYSQHLNNLIIAGGHGMMGLSLGPATGKLVAELALKQHGLSVPITAFGPERFK
ncbi:NAD(P)/FAD-dependent oxidoreductase [Pedobacter sp. ASV12]|uniref:NAD(P)/FAD-dependent oxidoreductase n=1 Tax=Pedobacter sp. ASV12 TaxID=2795120 RepID=UPI0018ED4E17|nr:FAD-dependent oxidoreductase [Pedobacter sp. ASV12]